MERSKVWNKSGKKPKPMNRQGKGARRNAKQNRENKARFIREDITCCQLCGRNSSLSNSHTESSDRRLEKATTALLCIWPCHQFLELECTHEERSQVNQFLIETDLEGPDRFFSAMRFLPEVKAHKFIDKIRGKVAYVEITLPTFEPCNHSQCCEQCGDCLDCYGEEECSFGGTHEKQSHNSSIQGCSRSDPGGEGTT